MTYFTIHKEPLHYSGYAIIAWNDRPMAIRAQYLGDNARPQKPYSSVHGVKTYKSIREAVQVLRKNYPNLYLAGMSKGSKHIYSPGVWKTLATSAAVLAG